MQCPNCHKTLPKSAYFCAYCGTPTRPKPKPRIWLWALGGAGGMLLLWLGLLGAGVLRQPAPPSASVVETRIVPQTIVVPQTVVAVQMRVVPQTVVVPQTAVAIQTVIVPQTIMVPQTVVAVQTVVMPRTLAPVAPTGAPQSTTDSAAAFISVKERGNDNALMAFVSAGEFTMGTANGSFENEGPQHTVSLDAFWIDQHEVTNASYKTCVDTGACQAPDYFGSTTRPSYYDNAQYADYPVVHVSWDDADIYCRWAGKRLPTEAEWEKAARGTDGRIYPWGDEFDQNRLNSGAGERGDTMVVGNFPSGASPYGALDMAGNVWEWTADWYDPNYYSNSPRNNPKGPANGVIRVVRGGAKHVIENDVRTAYRSYSRPDSRFDDFGFRCVQ